MATGLLMSAKPWLWALVALPASMAGFWVGGKAYRGFSRDVLMRVVAAMLIASGVSLIARGLA
jgi:uncharacterized membrane protein YfcA